MSKTTALLVIDVQVGIIEGMNAYRGKEVIQNINQLISKARAANRPIIYVHHDGPAGHRLEINTPGWKMHPSINYSDGETIVRKRECDSFYETMLQDELEIRKIDHLIITGCMTEFCIDTACRRAVSLGYDVTLVSDAHTTADNEIKKAAQIISHHNALLDRLCAGDHEIVVKPTEQVFF